MNQTIRKRIEDIKNGIVPEGYKTTKVGVIPDGWSLYKINEISTEIHDNPGDREYETLSISAGIGFVNQANKFGKEISGAQYSKYTVLRKGDFSYNKGNSKKYPQGCIYQLKDRQVAAVPNVFESFRLAQGHNEYYEQLFVSGYLNSQLFSKINHGVRDDGLLNLRGDDFYSCYIPFPSIIEQEKIAEILSAQDRLIFLKEKLIEQKKQQKKYFMQQLLTGKKRLHGFTGAWKKIKLENLAEIETGKADTQDKVDNGLYPFFVRSETVERINTFAYEGEAILTPGDGKIGEIYHYIDGKFNFHQRVYKISDFKECYGKFIFYYLTLFFKKRALTMTAKATVDSIRRDMLTGMTIHLPQIEEQQSISNILSQAYKEIELLQKDLEEEKRKKKALMQLLLTGIVRV